MNTIQPFTGVEPFYGDINWTLRVPRNIKQRLMAKNPWKVIMTSNQYVTQWNGQNVTFTLSFAFVPNESLRNMYEKHSSGFRSQRTRAWFGHVHPDDGVALFVKSSIPIEFVPKFKLMANDGSWYNMPVNWYGPNGTTRDEQFYGATKLMGITTLLNDYMANGKVTIRCILNNDVLTLQKLVEIDIYKNITDANVIEAIIISKVVNCPLIRYACLTHMASKTEDDVLAFPGIEQLNSDLFDEVLANLDESE